MNFSFSIRNIGQYCSPEKGSQVPRVDFLIPVFSGLRRMRFCGMDLDKSSAPVFCWVLKGEKIDYDFGPGRENWVLQIDPGSIVADAKNPEIVTLIMGNLSIRLPRVMPIQQGRFPYWQDELQQLKAAFHNPLPEQRLTADLSLLNLIKHFIRMAGTEEKDQSPVGQLKAGIDKDPGGHQTLEEISTHLGYSADHLRRLFKEKYGMPPLQYRNEKRLALAYDLIANSQKDLQEISEVTGFGYYSHFSACFKQRYHITPSNALKNYRWTGVQ